MLRTVSASDDTVPREATPESPSRVFTLRALEPGDLGWVIHRHGVVYWEEFGWNQEFEVLVARIVADYGADRDPARDNAWIACVDGRPAGCVFCVHALDDAGAAQLRILLVEPWARGMGIGAALIDACVGFARATGYRRLTLWTNDGLVAARRLYEAAGFRLVGEAPHHSFGHDLVGQNWEFEL
jgi:GNAT superfamily N-acetyltransferase